MVRIISIRYEDGYVLSELINSLEIETIICKFPMEEFDEHRVIFPDLSERVWRTDKTNYNDEEE